MTQEVYTAFCHTMRTIGYFEARPVLAVAVSGGIDSMALLLLADDWARQHGGYAIALTVDHGLREESSEEAAQVAIWCRALGIEHHTLVWKHVSPLVSAVQDKARAARYELLSGWCKTHHVLHLLTAHHRDDQAETLLLRLSRGSQIDGLAGIPLVSSQWGVRLLRPLLGMAKHELRSFLLQQGQDWVEDRSNESAAYTRNFLRQQVAKTVQPEYISAHAYHLAERTSIIRNQLENKLAIHLTKDFFLLPEGYAFLTLRALREEERHYMEKGLSGLVQAIGGGDTPARSDAIERLYETLLTAPSTRTFGGCLFQYQPRKERYIVRREPRAVGPPVMVEPSTTSRWDKRFDVRWHGKTREIDGIFVEALGTPRANALKLPASSLPPKPVLATLPAFFHLEQLVAVPHIHYRNEDYPNVTCHARFRPRKPLAGGAFLSMNTLSNP